MSSLIDLEKIIISQAEEIANLRAEASIRDCSCKGLFKMVDERDAKIKGLTEENQRLKDALEADEAMIEENRNARD